MNDITKEQQDKYIIEALAIAGFEENSEYPGMYAQINDNIKTVVDMTAGLSTYLYDIPNKEKIVTDNENGTLAKLDIIIADAKTGKMPTQSEPDIQYSKEAAPAHMPEVPTATPQQPLILAPQTDISDLTTDIIKQYICPAATEQEAYLFLRLCQARGLNPFIREAYLIKYGAGPATMVVGKDAFVRKAEEHPQFDGFEAGIIIEKNNGEIERREGALLLHDEKLIGGWAKVHRKDISHPFVSEVSYCEYEGHKKDGSVNKQWTTKPATMIRKVPLVQALREAFTAELSGMYDQSEMGVEVST